MSPDPTIDPTLLPPHTPAPASDPPDTLDVTSVRTKPRTPSDGTVTPPGVLHIPGYEITGLIARGGQGAVFAGRDLTLDREVAIKTLLPGADPDRFVTEAKITARLQHPGIPPAYALGTLPDGGHFLAMKLVRGDTLAQLLKDRPSPAADLPRFVQVFEQIAQAVGFAHSRGVLHRDLKPLNVMVGEFGEVQVMDWGLAKDQRTAAAAGVGVETAPDAPEHTQAGAVMGTPGYMAPEQARGEVVDVRADVFALGAVLAAVLTGAPAFVGTTARETIGKAAAADLADVLARLAGCGADADLVALARRCLAADAADRPADARTVAAEVADYRAGVEARLRQAETDRTRAETQAAEQRKRRRVVQWAGGGIAAVLLLGIVGTTVGLVQATAAADKERTANTAAQAAKIAAENAETKEREAKIAAQESAQKEKAANEQTQRGLKQIERGIEQFAGLMTGINPRSEVMGGPTVYQQLRERAEKAADALNADAVGDPLAVARLQTIYGTTLSELGNAAKAVELLEKARATRERKLGPDSLDTLTTLNELAIAHRTTGHHAEAVALLEKVREGRLKRHGAVHPHTLTALHNLAVAYEAAGRVTEAIALFEKVRDARSGALGIDHADTLVTLTAMGRVYQENGKVIEAVTILEQAHDVRVRTLGADHVETLVTLHNLAQAYQAAGKLAEAIKLFEQVRGVRMRVLGTDHPSTLNTLTGLANVYLEVDRQKEAISLMERVRDGRVRTVGTDHPDTLRALNNLATAYFRSGRIDEAVSLLEQVRDAMVRKQGAEHPDTLTALNNLATVYLEAGQPAKGVPLLEQVRKTQLKAGRADHTLTLQVMYSLATAYSEAGRFADAIALLEEVRSVRSNRLGADHPDTLSAIVSLAMTYQDAGKDAEAVALFEEAAVGSEKRKFRHRDADRIVRNTIGAYEDAGQLDKAEGWRRKWLAHVKEQTGTNTPDYVGELAALGMNLLQQRKWADAEPVLRECQTVRAKTQPEVWITFNTQSMLGESLLGQNKFADAGPLLLKGYEGMKAREKTIPPQGSTRIPEAVDRLIELYTATNKPDEVRKWRAERAKYPPPVAPPPREVKR